MYKHGPALIMALIRILQIVGFKNGTPSGMDASTLMNNLDNNSSSIT